MLFAGISLVQLQPTNGSSSQAKENTSNETVQEEKVSQSPLLGLAAVIMSSLCSGFAGAFCMTITCILITVYSYSTVEPCYF